MGFGPTVLYHQTAPEGQSFYTKEEFDNALQDGWVEAPWLVGDTLKPWQKAIAARKAKAQAKKEAPLKPIKSSGED